MPRKVDATPASSRRGWLRVVGVLVIAAAGLMVGRTCVRQRDAVASAARVAPSAAPAVAAVAPTKEVDPAPAVAGPVLDPNGHQMRTMLFDLDGNGLSLRQSSITNGRVKAPPISNAPRRLEFEVHGPDGTVTYTGAVDHPLWQNPEAANDKGEFTTAERRVASGTCFVRIPAELPATSIEFFEVDTTSGNAGRRSLGSFDLP